MSVDTLKTLYDSVALDYNIGSYEEFKKNLEDEDKRKSFYDAVSKDFNLPKYDKFSDKVTRLITPSVEEGLPGENNSYSDGTKNVENPTPPTENTEDYSIENGDPDALLQNQINKNKEDAEFKDWYAITSQKYGLDPDPNHPNHFYDYKSAWLAGVEPEVIEKEDGSLEYHWPSQFKADNHPNRYILDENNIKDTKEGWSIPKSEYTNALKEKYGLNDESIKTFNEILESDGFLKANESLSALISKQLSDYLEIEEEPDYSSKPMDYMHDGGQIANSMIQWFAASARYGYREAMPDLYDYLKTGKIPSDRKDFDEYIEKWMENTTNPMRTSLGEDLAWLASLPLEYWNKFSEYVGEGISGDAADNKLALWMGYSAEVGMKSLPFILPIKAKYNAKVRATKGYNPTLWNKLTKNKITDYRVFPDVTFNAGPLKSMLKGMSNKQKNKYISQTAKNLGIKPSQLKKLIENGGEIKVNWANYTKLVDKPWFKKLKQKLNIKPGTTMTGELYATDGFRFGRKSMKQIKEKGIIIDGETIIPPFKKAKQSIQNNVAKSKNVNSVIKDSKINPDVLNKKTPLDITPSKEPIPLTVEPEKLATVGNETTVPPSIAEQAKLRIQERQQKAELDAKTKQKSIIEEQIDLEEVATGKPSKLRDVSKSIDKDIKKLETPKPKVKDAKKPITKDEAAIADFESKKVAKDKPIVAKEKSQPKTSKKPTVKSEKLREVSPKVKKPKHTKNEKFAGIGLQGREIFQAEINGKPQFFYRSSSGTAGNYKGRIMPFEGYGKHPTRTSIMGNDWLIKKIDRQVGSYEEGLSFYSKEVQEAAKYLDSKFPYDKSGKQDAQALQAIGMYGNTKGTHQRYGKFEQVDVNKVLGLDSDGNPIKTTKPKVESSPVPLKSGKWTKIQGKTEKGEAIHGISIKGKDYFVQKKPTGSGGKFEIHKVDLNGKSLGVVGKNFNQAMSKIKSQARESAPKIVKPKPKIKTTGNKKMDASILKEDIEIQKIKDFLDKNSEKITPLTDVRLRVKVRDLEAQKESKIETFEQAAKTAKIQEKSIEKLKLRIKENKYKKSDDKYFDKNELKQREIDLKNAKIIMNRLIDYKPKRVMQDGMYVYSSIIPPIPPAITNWIKGRVKQFKTKTLNSEQLKSIVQGFKGNSGNPAALPPPNNNLGVIAKKVLVDAHRKKKFQIIEAERVSQPWLKLDENLRKDVGAAVERIGRIDIKGDTYAKIMERWTPVHRKLMQEYQISIEAQRRLINEELSKLTNDQYIWFLENYLPHIYQNPKQVKAFINHWRKTSRNFKERKYPTLKEAMDAGLKPLTQDVAYLHNSWVNANWNVVATRQVIDFLSKMKSPRDNGPLIRPLSKAPDGWNTTTHPVFSSIDKVVAFDPIIEPVISIIEGYKGYSKTTIPETALGYDLTTSAATNWMVGKSPLRMYDSIVNWSKGLLLGFSFFHYFPLMESYYARMNPLKTARKGSALIPGPIALLDNFLPPKVKMGFEGEFDKVRTFYETAMDDVNFRKRVAESGLQYEVSGVDFQGNKMIEGLMKLESLFSEHIYLKQGMKPIKGLRKGLNKMNAKLWDEFHTPIKVYCWNETCNLVRQKYPNENLKVIDEVVAEIINSNFGGIEWMNEGNFLQYPRVQKILTRMFLSPDWSYSAVKNFYDAIPSKFTGPIKKIINFNSNKKGKAYGNPDTGGYTYGRPKWAETLQQQYLGRIAAYLTYQTAITQAIIQSLSDDEEMAMFPWDNEEGAKDAVDITPIMRAVDKAFGYYDPIDKTRYYMSYGKQFTEVLNYFELEEAKKQAYNKMSGPARTITEQVFGMQLNNKEYMLDFEKAAKYEKDYDVFKKRAYHLFKNTFVPFSFNEHSNFFFPVRKGKTYSKALDDFHLLFWQYANEEDWNKIVDNHPDYIDEDTYWELYPKLIKSYENSGVDWQKAYQVALNNFRNYNVNMTISSIIDEDVEEARRYAAMAAKFGAQYNNFSEKLLLKVGNKYHKEMVELWMDTYVPTKRVISGKRIKGK